MAISAAELVKLGMPAVLANYLATEIAAAAAGTVGPTGPTGAAGPTGPTGPTAG